VIDAALVCFRILESSRLIGPLAVEIESEALFTI
jgi:hypothetical protein